MEAWPKFCIYYFHDEPKKNQYVSQKCIVYNQPQLIEQSIQKINVWNEENNKNNSTVALVLTTNMKAQEEYGSGQVFQKKKTTKFPTN